VRFGRASTKHIDPESMPRSYGGVLGLRILAGVGLTLFGMLQIVFPSPFAGIDFRFHRWMSRRVPALCSTPGMRHLLHEWLQVKTTVSFGGFFVVVGVLVMLGVG
jgi:hypothetical protein